VLSISIGELANQKEEDDDGTYNPRCHPPYILVAFFFPAEHLRLHRLKMPFSWGGSVIGLWTK
jgi:hypothetical protein